MALHGVDAAVPTAGLALLVADGDADQSPDAALRRALLLELYEQGLTHREIGERMGIGSDWVRQLLRHHEVPAVPVWERRYRRAIAGRESEIIAAFLRLRSYHTAARQLGLSVMHVRRLVDGAVPEAGVLCRARRTLGQTYTERELLDALRTAALDAPSPMSIESYGLWAREAGGGRRRPGSEVIKLRFGGWRRALAQADLPTNSRRGPQASFRYTDVVAAVAAAWRDHGRYPSVARYDAWRAGRAELPAASTARRFVRSWDDLLVAAYPLVYQIGIPKAPCDCDEAFGAGHPPRGRRAVRADAVSELRQSSRTTASDEALAGACGPSFSAS